MIKPNPSLQLLRSLALLKTKNLNRLNKTKRKFASQHKIGMISNADLLRLYRDQLKRKKIKANSALASLLQKRKIRTLSGVAPIAVLTKPYPCPGKCIYCPTEKNMPKSYLSNEPAVMRAIATKFDPFKQVTARLRALTDNGHETDKLELIVMGGTWSCLPRTYQNWFIKRCFEAANGRVAKNLIQAQILNESAKHRIIGLTLETRPDYINEDEIKYWRKLGATRVELGVQSVDDEILNSSERGHGAKEIIRATKLFKQAGFKVAYHLMPNLPGATPTKDLANFKKLFSNENFQPDMIKIYPTVVTKNSKLYGLWKKGGYQPYSNKQLLNLLLKTKLAVPEYVRIIRLIRDIPKESIEAGNLISNLRENLKIELKKQGKFCRCIRCREVREEIKGANKSKLFITKYQASGATEYFLQYASNNKRKLFAFLRLRLPRNEKNFIPEIQNSAMIREVHTYGRLIPINKGESGVQHIGLGSKLMQQAEEVAAKNGFSKIAVISGVGVRGFYCKLGYKQEGTYMLKPLNNQKLAKN
ncbi:MAG: tRNA uridine(34) 5-carboxymethylaminomethyl modification radical SAM/GNAT enzyme Elp3 [Patescibacteria group bacterium]